MLTISAHAWTAIPIKILPSLQTLNKLPRVALTSEDVPVRRGTENWLNDMLIKAAAQGSRMGGGPEPQYGGNRHGTSVWPKPFWVESFALLAVEGTDGTPMAAPARALNGEKRLFMNRWSTMCVYCYGWDNSHFLLFLITHIQKSRWPRLVTKGSWLYFTAGMLEETN